MSSTTSTTNAVNVVFRVVGVVIVEDVSNVANILRHKVSIICIGVTVVEHEQSFVGCEICSVCAMQHSVRSITEFGKGKALIAKHITGRDESLCPCAVLGSADREITQRNMPITSLLGKRNNERKVEK